GRAQLAAMAGAVELSIGVSHFNASELRSAGHSNVHVGPLFGEPERFDAGAAAEAVARTLRRAGPLVGSLSPRVPHKPVAAPHAREEDLLELQFDRERLDSDARLLVVGPFAKGSAYFRSLELKAQPGVTFTGTLTHAELVAAYRAADAYISMSEHEGFGVPLI